MLAALLLVTFYAILATLAYREADREIDELLSERAAVANALLWSDEELDAVLDEEVELVAVFG